MKTPFRIETTGTLGKDARVLLVFSCPECGSETKADSRGLRANQKVECRCGVGSFVVTNDGLREAQRGLDQINASVKKLEETFKRLSR